MKRTLVIGYGLLTHTIFGLSVSLMLVSLRGELGMGWIHLQPHRAWLLDALLLLQFPFLHSFFLGRRGGRILEALTPGKLGRSLATTNYALIASLQIGLVFALWCPTGVTLYEPGVPWSGLELGVYGAAWLLLLKAMWDAGLDLQTGSLGWTSVAAGKPVPRRGFPTSGMFRLCRQPVYFAFAMVLWTGPVWTLDHLLIALVWGGYCLLGPRLKERRYLARYGAPFNRYQRETPYFLPLRLPRGS